MKKITVMTLILIMMLSLAACAISNDEIYAKVGESQICYSEFRFHRILLDKEANSYEDGDFVNLSVATDEAIMFGLITREMEYQYADSINVVLDTEKLDSDFENYLNVLLDIEAFVNAKNDYMKEFGLDEKGFKDFFKKKYVKDIYAAEGKNLFVQEYLTQYPDECEHDAGFAYDSMIISELNRIGVEQIYPKR